MFLHTRTFCIPALCANGGDAITLDCSPVNGVCVCAFDMSVSGGDEADAQQGRA